MKVTLLIICAFWFCLTESVEAYDLLIVKSQPSPVYDEVLRGLHSVKPFTERVITLSDYYEIDFGRMVREDRPAVVVTLGDLAREAVRKTNHVNLVSLMALNYRQNPGTHSSVKGIDVRIPPERYLSLFRQMKLQRVGVLYSKGQSGSYLQQAQKDAAKSGVTMVTKEVSSPKEVVAQLDTLKGNVDALWLLPDSAVISKLTIEGFVNFSMEQQVPLISYARLHLANGASAVVEFDRTDLGVQAGEMINTIMEGQSTANEIVPRKAVLQFNHTILKRLGISSELVNRIQQNWE